MTESLSERVSELVICSCDSMLHECDRECGEIIANSVNANVRELAIVE